jgi:hypothetical protein
MPCIATLNKQKCLFTKKGEKEGKTVSIWGFGTSGRGEDIRKGYRRVNVVEILCTHIHKWKNETC